MGLRRNVVETQPEERGTVFLAPSRGLREGWRGSAEYVLAADQVLLCNERSESIIERKRRCLLAVSRHHRKEPERSCDLGWRNRHSSREQHDCTRTMPVYG